MNRFVLPLLMATALAGGATGAMAASPFDGTWTMDVAKSQLTGDTMTYEATPTGFKTVGSVTPYSFAIDGKEYPQFAGRTAAWSKAPDGGFDVVYKVNGKVVTKTHRTLSADGKTLTNSYVQYRPDGSTVTEKDVYTRTAGTMGLAGTWKSVKADVSPDTMVITTPAPGAFKIENRTYKQVIMGKTDGSKAEATGPSVPPGAVAKFKAEGPMTWHYTYAIQDKVVGEGVMTVSADAKTLTDTNWAPGKESEKAVMVYVKP